MEYVINHLYVQICMNVLIHDSLLDSAISASGFLKKTQIVNEIRIIRKLDSRLEEVSGSSTVNSVETKKRLTVVFILSDL
jgi:hypothetical protein